MSEKIAILAQLNNEGARYIMNGHFSDACRIFKSALSMGIRIGNEIGLDEAGLGDHQDDKSFEQEVYTKICEVRQSPRGRQPKAHCHKAHKGGNH